MFVYRKNRPLPIERWTPKLRTKLGEKMWQGKHGTVPANIRKRTGRPPFAK